MFRNVVHIKDKNLDNIKREVFGFVLLFFKEYCLNNSQPQDMKQCNPNI